MFLSINVLLRVLALDEYGRLIFRVTPCSPSPTQKHAVDKCRVNSELCKIG